jgi:putative ATP-binding cassette transporter
LLSLSRQLGNIDSMSKIRNHVVFKLMAILVRSPYRWRMLGTLLVSGGVIAVELGMGLALAKVMGRMIDALTHQDAAAFKVALLSLMACLIGFFVCTGLYLYLNLRLLMQARTALTYPWLRMWLGEDAIYRIEREHLVDNPDQRITEDLNLFLQSSIGLLSGGLGAIGGVWVYSAQLWKLGGPLQFQLGGQTWTIAGFLFWVVLIYSILDFVLSRRIGRPLVGLNMQQQHFEADFRFGLVQVRENAEQVALYRGASTEFRRLTACFERVRQNWWRLILFQLGFGTYRSTAGHVQNYMLYLLLAPKVLLGAMTIGTLTTLQSMVGQTLSRMNWLANSWQDILVWLAVVNRLKELDQAVHAPPVDGIAVGEGGAANLSMQELALALPDGSPLTDIGNVRMEPGQRWLVRGPSGVGKSTLLRAIAGLWPYGGGRIEPPGGKLLFLPQKSYLPWDTLKAALAYPHAASTFSDEDCRQALMDCRLPALVGQLHERHRWSPRLSLGEQQRVAFARALLIAPDYLFLDEATSALDLETESHLYGLLLERLPHTTLVSVAHRPTLEAFHTFGLRVGANGPAITENLAVPT